MILPSKHLSQDRALLTVGAEVLQCLSRPVTVSALWQEMRVSPRNQKKATPLRYDSFILALDLLFLIGALEWSDGLLVRGRA
jgi:hypothetical protein